jgi:hydrogenase-4 component F
MIICSVGIAIGLFGTVLTYYSSVNILGESSDALNWSTLASISHQLDPKVMKLAFLFIVIGYGTKVGLAPMHTWLPDAHSQAPSPISGLLSGVLLSCAMYGILRFYIITKGALGPAYPSSLLLMFGLASLIMAAFFLIIQKDFKRMLAYSSVEHMGIIAVGLSFSVPLGTYGAMLHLFNNAMAKSMMFFAAGNIVLRYGTKEIEKVKGLGRLMPVTGTVFLLGALAMTGSPPFSLFISELTILAAGFSSGKMISSLVLLFCVVLIFASILYYVNAMTFGVPPSGIQKGELSRWSTLAMLMNMAFVMILGFYIPKPLNTLINQVVQIISGS